MSKRKTLYQNFEFMSSGSLSKLCVIQSMLTINRYTHNQEKAPHCCLWSCYTLPSCIWLRKHNMLLIGTRLTSTDKSTAFKSAFSSATKCPQQMCAMSQRFPIKAPPSLSSRPKSIAALTSLSKAQLFIPMLPLLTTLNPRLRLLLICC
jgi:hypothetical protein